MTLVSPAPNLIESPLTALSTSFYMFHESTYVEVMHQLASTAALTSTVVSRGPST